MSYVCSELVNNVCQNWVEQLSLIDQLAITQAQLYMLATPIIGIYSVIIAFVMFSNFSKRA